MGRRTLVAAQVALLAASITGAVMTSQVSDWTPVVMVLVLASLAVVSDAMAIETKVLRLSGSFISLVLAMALLGPAPAVLIGVLTVTLDRVRRNMQAWEVLTNLAAYAAFPLAGGLAVRAMDLDGAEPLNFAFGIFGVFAVTNTLNFFLIALPFVARGGGRLTTSFRTLFVPMLPSEALAGALAVVTAISYREIGLS